jgi:predicted  nucleic acid-binding Zn-ribbon protein
MRLLRFRLLAGLGVATALGAVLAAQTSRTSEGDVLGALLVEVRGLRQAMENMATAGPRVQLALGRLQLQEQRINTILRRLESVRDGVSGAQRPVDELQHKIAQLENELKSADSRTDSEAFIKGATFEIGEMKVRLRAATAELQRLQEEQSFLEQQISAEQSRWADINRALEELERTLGRK